MKALLLVALLVNAPSSADPDLSPWFQSLKSPMGMSCCAQADGHILHDSEWRAVKDGYEVLINGAWVPVPAESVLQRADNPTGGAVVFYPPSGAPPIYCFVRPAET
jgi:hypothetical protein